MTHPSVEAMKSAVELEIHNALGTAETVVIGKLIQRAIDAAIAAQPAPAEESVTEEELEQKLFSSRNRGSEGDHQHAIRISRLLLSSFTITRKSEAKS